MNRRTSAWVATHAPTGTRWGTKTLALLLSLVLCLTLLPTAVFAEGEGNTNTSKAIQIGTSQINGGQASSVYFGKYQQSSNDNDPIKWRVLSNANKNLFLLSDRNLDVLKYHTDRTGVSWETSSLRSWLNNTFLEAAFSSKEKTAIADTHVLNKEHHGTSAGNNTTDKIFLLSIEEGLNPNYGFSSNASQTGESTGRVSLNTAYAKSKLTNQSSDDRPFDRNDAGDWWLRSPGSGGLHASLVSENGYLNYSGYDVDSNNIAVRPAFNLNLNSVLFTSAAEGGKADTAVDENLTAVTDYDGSEWKLTLLDSDHSKFSAELKSRTDSTVVVSYTGASAGTNEYVSAMVKNGDTVKYYGRIADVSAADGTVAILLPDNFSAAAGDKLYVFNEQYNGEKQTDYASELAEIQLDGSHTHCFCGGDVTAGDHTSHTDVTYQEWNGTDSITYGENGKAYVYLADNAQFARDLNIDNGQTLYLCLNGKEYKCIDYGKINVNPGGCLYLCDCQGTGKIVGNDLISSRFGSGCINITGYYNQTEEPATGYIFGGTITGGVAKLHGGGIFVENNCILSIYGGTITGNRALWYGGGVHVMSDSVVNLYGGTITGNTTDRICGGMFVAADSELNISGAPVVEGNTDGEGTCNILLADPSAKQINFAGEMTEGAKLGITVTTFSDERVYPAVFSSACDTDYSSYFFADNKEIHVEYNSDKKLQLAEEAKPHTHVWATEWSSNDTHHWHNCTADGCDITDNAQKDGYAEHSGTDDGNCTTAVDCETCNYQIKNAELAHSYPDTWTPVRPGSTHTCKCQNKGCTIEKTQNCVSDGKATCQDFAKCTICGGDCGTKADHDFTAETVDAQYLKSAATCTEKAVYYKSCSVCGLSSQGTADEATFESGEFDANNHTGPLGDWQYNADTHWKEYPCCGAKADEAEHSFTIEKEAEQYLKSAATCTAKAVYYKSCVCGAKGSETFESGEVNADAHTGILGDWQYNADTHWKEYSCCGAMADEAEHAYDNDADATCNTCPYERQITPPAPDTYTVTVTASDGGAASASPSSAEAGTEITLTATPDTGYHFREWQVVSGDVTIHEGKFTMPAGNVEIKAIFEADTPLPVKYTVTFHANGGSTVGSQTVKSGGKAVEPPQPTRTGYTFAGWYLGNVPYDFNTPVTKDITLTAGWIPSVYAIRYRGIDNAVLDRNAPRTHTYGTFTVIPNPSKTGYIFEGWLVNGSRTAVKNLTLSALGYTADITLTAVWTRVSSGEEVSPVYSIFVKTAENGSVSTNYKSAYQGTRVTVTIVPDKGYMLETLTVLDKNGKEIPLLEWNSEYAFLMPASNVTVKATFLEDNTMLNYFVDVPKDAYYYDAVLWAAMNGITSGTDALHFSPDEPCTRAQVITFLWRAAGCPVVNYAMNLTDVSEDAYYAEAVRWALSDGITTGTSATTFSPDDICTRVQAITFLCRYAAYQGMETVAPLDLVSVFADAASVPDYALPAMNWALACEIVQGDGKNLMPNDICTRAQIVTLLYRSLAKKS